MDRKKTATQVWKEIEAALGHRVSKDERALWQSLITPYIEQRITWDELINPIRAVWAGRSPSHAIEEMVKSPQPAPSVKGITRATVLEEVVTAHAAQDPEIVQFREAVLEGTLLKEHEIQPWIAQQQEKERERPALFLDAVPLPAGHDIRDGVHGGIVPDPPLSVGEEHPAGRLRVDLLDYGTPDSTWVQRVPVAHGGVLARLHYLSATLAQRYHWQAAQATAFVLTGLPPVLHTIDATWDMSSFQTQTGSVTALSRLVLSIDPTLSPKEVHDYFQSIRQRLLGAKWRDLKENQLALARFAIHRAPEEPWEQRMAAWNTEFPQWSYKEKNLGHFRRDCQHAIEKLLAPVPPGRPPQ
jgi:hypothetical protein